MSKKRIQSLGLLKAQRHKAKGSYPTYTTVAPLREEDKIPKQMKENPKIRSDIFYR